MAVYVVRLNDGSCIIGEASSQAEAREEFLSRWDSSGTEPEEIVLSVREMHKGSFLSRWWPSADDVYEEAFTWEILREASWTILTYTKMNIPLFLLRTRRGRMQSPNSPATAQLNRL